MQARTIAPKPKSSGSGPGREPQVTHYEHVRNFWRTTGSVTRFWQTRAVVSHRPRENAPLYLRYNGGLNLDWALAGPPGQTIPQTAATAAARGNRKSTT
jgi:hypothetical protein